MHILIAEDERDLNRVLEKTLRAAGYGVDCCFDGAEALDYLRCGAYDAAVLDVRMPRLTGFEAVRRFRAEGGRTPVLFLTARDSVDDRVEGLDLGGNDYLVKPFAFAELLARLRALLRAGTTQGSAVYAVADLRLDTRSHTVTRGGQEIALSPREYAMLEYLIANAGTVLSREQIEDHVWNLEYEGGSNVVDVYIRYLRRKLEDGFGGKLLHTVRGAGYVLREDA